MGRSTVQQTDWLFKGLEDKLMDVDHDCLFLYSIVCYEWLNRDKSVTWKLLMEDEIDLDIAKGKMQEKNTDKVW